MEMLQSRNWWTLHKSFVLRCNFPSKKSQKYFKLSVQEKIKNQTRESPQWESHAPLEHLTASTSLRQGKESMILALHRMTAATGTVPTTPCDVIHRHHPAVGGWFCVLFSDPFDDVLTKNATRKRSGILLVWLRLRVSEGKNANFKERSAGPDDTILFLALQNFCVISIFYLWTFSSTFVRIFGLLFCFRVSAPRAPAKLAYSLRSLAFGSLICVRPEMTFGNVAAFMTAWKMSDDPLRRLCCCY